MRYIGEVKLTINRGYRGYESCWVIKPNVCNSCGRDKELIAHHIVPVISCGVHSKENIIFVCRDCHKKNPRQEIKLIKKRKTKPEFNILLSQIKNFGENTMITDNKGDTN